MLRKTAIALAAGALLAGAAAPAHAQWYGRGYYPAPRYYAPGAGLALGTIAGLGIGAALGSAYAAPRYYAPPPPVVYYAPPPAYEAPPPVYYAPPPPPPPRQPQGYWYQPPPYWVPR